MNQNEYVTNIERRTSLHGSLQFASSFAHENAGPKASLLNVQQVETSFKSLKLAVFFMLCVFINVILFILSLHRWAHTDYQKGIKALYPGYDGLDFIALCGLFVFPAFALFFLCMTSSSISRSQLRPFIKAMLYLVLCACLSIAAAFLWKYCWDSLSCGIFWCTNKIEDVDDLYHKGLIQSLATAYFFSCVAFSFLSFCKSVTYLSPSRPYIATETIVLNGTLTYGETLYVALVLCIIFPLCWFATTLLPNTWEHWTGSGISNSMATGTISKRSAAEHDSNIYFKSTSFVLSSGKYVMKFYADITIFYSFLYCILLCGLILQAFPILREYANVRVQTPHMEKLNLIAITRGEICFWILHTVFFGMFTLYWTHDHWYHKRDTLTDIELWARTSGQIGNWVMAMLLFPASRYSGILPMLGISWEASIRFHKFFGYAFIAITFIHMALWWKVWNDTPGVGFYFIQIPDRKYPHGHDEPTVPLVTISFYVLIFIVFPATFLRRYNFEFFYFTHMFSLIYIPIVIAHSMSGWYFTLPMIILYGIDRIIRHYRNTRIFVVDEIIRSKNILTLRIADDQNKSGLQFKAGQYVFLQVPSISVLQNHPFTISNSPLHASKHNYLEFNVKVMGNQTFTDALKNVKEREVVHIDGPYGTPAFRHNIHDQLLLIAGGIGFTPCHSLLQEILLSDSNVRVHLVWSVKDENLFQTFAETLNLCMDRDNISFDLYVTSQSVTIDMEDLPFDFNKGRPKFSKEMLGSFQLLPRTLCFVCGPESLRKPVSRFALKHSLPFHEETFML